MQAADVHGWITTGLQGGITGLLGLIVYQLQDLKAQFREMRDSLTRRVERLENRAMDGEHKPNNHHAARV